MTVTRQTCIEGTYFICVDLFEICVEGQRSAINWKFKWFLELEKACICTVFLSKCCVYANVGAHVLPRSVRRQEDMMRSELQRLREGGLTSAFSSASRDSSKWEVSCMTAARPLFRIDGLSYTRAQTHVGYIEKRPVVPTQFHPNAWKYSTWTKRWQQLEHK